MTTSFGPYRLLRRIAHGGMGEIYLAVLERESGFTKTVALKMMLPTVASKPSLAELFESEASVAAMLNHPNIVQIFDHGTIEGKTFITMEFVEGPDLSSLIEKTQAPFPLDIASEIAVQLCRGLAHAHARRDLHGRRVGIVHGDVSPPNILISQEGQAKLADFGLARVRTLAAQEGLITGKYSYMSPEQARGSTLTEKSDLYSLGLVVYELLTAARAFPLRETPTQTLEALQKGHCIPATKLRPDLPKEVGNFLDRALCVSPDDRYTTASEMSSALARLSPPCGPEKLSEFVQKHTPETLPTRKLAPDPTEMAKKPISPSKPNRRWLTILVALFTIAWGSTLTWWLLHTPPKNPPPPTLHLPKAPTTLSVHPVIEPLKTPERKPNRKHKIVPAPEPEPEKFTVSLSIPKGFQAHLDHKSIQGLEINLSDLSPHLIHLHPHGKLHPEVTLRLTPPKDPKGNWRAAVHSNPWMQIQLGKRPIGQTPKSNLPLPNGPSALLLKRDDLEIPLTLDIHP